MKLKEFGLWAYKFDLDDSRKFTLENRCVCAHFERHFDGLETDGVYRVIVKLSDGDPRDGTFEVSSSVLKYYEKFDFCSFHNMDLNHRKHLLLATLYKSLLRLCELHDWDKEPFEIARSRVIEDNFTNSYEICSKNNPNRSLVASLNAEHTATEFKLDIVVKNKTGDKVLARSVLSAEPDEFLFNSQIGRLQWQSSDVLNYVSKDKRVLETLRF